MQQILIESLASGGEGPYDMIARRRWVKECRVWIISDWTLVFFFRFLCCSERLGIHSLQTWPTIAPCRHVSMTIQRSLTFERLAGGYMNLLWACMNLRNR